MTVLDVGLPRVLLVDGSATAAIETFRPIADAGARCELVPTIDAAVSSLRAQPASMVVVDALSLATDERKVLDQVVLVRQTANVPVLIVGREGTSAEVVESLWRAGADDLIFKPVRIKQIAARLAAVAAAPSLVERRNMRVLLLIAGDETRRRLFGPLLEHEGFQLVYATADDAGLASLGATRFDCLVIALGESDREVTALLDKLVARRPELSAVPTVLIAVTRPSPPPPDPMVTWLEGQVAPELVVRALHQFTRRATTVLQAHTRVPFFCLVEFRDTGAAGEPWVTSFSFDLSPQGIFLKTLVPARPGTTIEFKIHLTTTGEEMLGTGVVAWANTVADRKAYACPVGMGIQFLGMSPKPLAKLREICRITATQFPRPERP